MASDGATLLAFRISDRRFALDASRVAEIAARPPVTRVPHAPPSLAGVASFRGRVLPVIRLGDLLGIEAGANPSGRMIILGGGEPIGLAVDEVIGLETGGTRGLVETADGAARLVPLEQLLDTAFVGRGRSQGATTLKTQTRAPGRPAEAAAEAGDDVALLAFLLAGQPYALPLDCVREVIAAPPDLAALPGVDAAMLGVATWRGALTPIVSTRVLLGLPPADRTSAVVVAMLGDAHIGFAVDEVTAIVRTRPDAIGPVPKMLNRGAGEARIAAMLRTGDGGLVSMLDPEQLFTEESVAQILQDSRRAERAEDVQPTVLLRFLIFQLGAEIYGMDIAEVQEVALLPEKMARVPRAPTYVLGVMNLRGTAVPVIDQRLRFGVADSSRSPKPGSKSHSPGARSRVLVVKMGDLVAGFAVDAVTRVLEVTPDRLSPTPELTEDGARLFDRVAPIEESGEVILLVNPRELLDRAERDVVAALAADAAASEPPSPDPPHRKTAR